MKEAFWGLPNDVVFCSRCVISNQRPNSTIEFKHEKITQKETIAFDENGVCDACRFDEVKDRGIDWLDREEQLMKLCDQYRRPTGYDVIVPGSGGKDSAFTSHILKYKYGMNPLTVTWAPHLYTDIGWKNFENWMHVGGLDNLLFTPNGLLHRKLTELAFTNLLHPFQPFIVGQRIIGPSIAQKFGVELVMYGENQAEYGNNSAENSIPTMNKSFFTSNGTNDLKLGGVGVKEISNLFNFTENDFSPYLPIDAVALQKSKIDVHYLGYYLKWDPQECFYYAVENTGFEPNTERTQGSYSKYSSIDDKIDPFHYFTTRIKFGLGRASYDAAQEIRNGKITRAEGIELVRKYDHEFPDRFFPEFLTYMGISSDTFFNTIDKFRSPHLWEYVNNEWHLTQTVFS